MTKQENADLPDASTLNETEMTRRTAAKALSGIAGAAAIGSFSLAYLTGLPGKLDSGTKQLYVKGTKLVNENGDTLTVDALSPDKKESMTVFPQKKGGGALKSKSGSTLLVRFPEDQYKSPTNIDGTAKGYAAYSKVCTHEGCLVSGGSGEKIKCPCHGSVYDMLAGANVVDGPAPRALPQLPLGIADDAKGSLLVATGPFEGPIGPSK